MENNKLPYISVIITACIRKEFLLNAIKSVLNQTLDKKYYEIIVIKNFREEDIDNFINKNNIIGLLSNQKSLPGKLVEALSCTRGTVLSFLDDDDLFFENKLEVVYNKFKKDNNIAYYHNLCIPINENGQKLNINNLNTSPDANMSAISIKKSIVKLNKSDKINGATDALMYLYALESKNRILNGKETLTYYMFHNSISNFISNNFDEYRKFIITQPDLGLNSLIFFKNLVHSKKAINYLNFRITSEQIYKYIFGANYTPCKLINFIIYNRDGIFNLGSFKYKIELILIYMLIKIYPKSRTYINKKIWNSYRKSTIR